MPHEYRFSPQVAAVWGPENIGWHRLIPASMHQFIEELAARASSLRQTKHPELRIRTGRSAGINGWKVRGKAIPKFMPRDKIRFVQIYDEPDRSSRRNGGEQIRQGLVLIVDGVFEFNHINNQVAVLLEAIDQMEAISASDRNRRHLLTRLTGKEEEATTEFRPPLQRIHQALVSAYHGV